MRARRPALVLVSLTLALVAGGCASLWPVVSPGGVPRLAGTWQGWMAIPRLGNAAARMTVKADGGFDGVLRLDDGDRPFHGSISALASGALRYDGTFGDGDVALRESAGGPTLKLVPDGGGGVATFVPAR